jgi:hypothetical protein
MTQKIIIPVWEKLSDLEKKQVEECIDSILSARQASVTLLKLLSQNQANPDFIAKLEEFSNQQSDFQIVPSNTELLISNNTEDICHLVCTVIEIAGVNKKDCIKKCLNSV